MTRLQIKHLAVMQTEFGVEEDKDLNLLGGPTEFRDAVKADARKLLSLALIWKFVAVVSLPRSLS